MILSKVSKECFSKLDKILIKKKITCENSQDIFGKEIIKDPLTLPNIEMCDT